MSDLEAVGAPPFALPEEEGGSAAVVGHPDPPESIAASAVDGVQDDPALVPPKPVKKAEPHTAPHKAAEPHKAAHKAPVKKAAAKRTAHRT